jgi:hypothetical protein
MDIHSDDEASYTMQCQNTFLNSVENEYCAEYQRQSGNKSERDVSSHTFSATATGSVQSSCDPYNLTSDDDEYLTHKNVAEMTPRRRDCTAPLLTAARLYFDSPPVEPKNWG